MEDEREAVLIRRISRGDPGALTVLFNDYYPRIFKFVIRLTGSRSTAEELANDVMLTVWRQAQTFRGDSKVSTWVFGIAYRQTMRRITRKKLSLVPAEDIDSFAAEREGRVENSDWLGHAIRRLPPAQQLAVLLVFYLGLSYEETALVTDCPVNTVKTRMFHARRKLREFLADDAEPVRRVAE